MEIDTIKRVVRGRASREERREVERWAAESADRQRFLRDARRYYGGVARGGRRLLYGLSGVAAVAASVLLLWWVGFLSPAGEQTPKTIAMAETSGVQLILPDGSSHMLSGRDTIGESMTSIPGFAREERGAIRQLHAAEDTLPAELQYNRIVVPRGTTYSLVLEDGTRVVLNAESSLRFPERFTGGERRVFLEGEAYLEVKRDERRPFLVEVERAVVRVLGTEFNVRAYPGEESLTALVSGSVEVTVGEDSLCLRPGEACVEGPGGRPLVKREVDLMEVLAWKNGEFVFKDMPLSAMMEELARWYDIEVECPAGELGEQRFHVYMDRSKTLEEALSEIARVADITYYRDGKKIIIREK